MSSTDLIAKVMADARRAYTERVERDFVNSFAKETAAVEALRKENDALRKQVTNLQAFLKQLHDLLWEQRR